MESVLSSDWPKITFQDLQARLIQLVNIRLQNGDFTERGLAKILGISQPQIHHVLKGARKLRPELADRILSLFDLSVWDLLDTAELATVGSCRKPPVRQIRILPSREEQAS